MAADLVREGMFRSDEPGDEPGDEPAFSFEGVDDDRGGAAPVAIDRNDIPDPAREASLADLVAPQVGFAGRLIRSAYRLGVSPSLLTRPFGRTPKPRLRATVENPLAGDRVAGTAMRAGHFLVLGARLPLGAAGSGPDARLAPPCARVIHGFTWLADLEASAPHRSAAPLAAQLTAAWLDANRDPPRRPANGGAWTVANTGWRVLNWLIHAPLILSGDDVAARTRVRQAIAADARWLERHMRGGDDRLGEFAGWCALVAAGLLLPGGRPRRLHAEAALVRTFGALVADDGGVLSRSPLAQIEAIALVVKLRACYRATRRDPPAAVETMLSLLVPPLLAVTHADGSLGSWQGGWAVTAEHVAALVAASGVRARPPRGSRPWGYQRVAAQRSVLLLDGAPPPLPRHSLSACASTLGIEFSHGSQRLIVNCGGAAAAGALVPADFERGLRATAAHSALVLDDSNSTAILSDGRVGSGVGEVEVDRSVLGKEELGLTGHRGATRIEACHDGYAARYGLVHTRVLVLADDGSELHGEDTLEPAKRRGKRRKVGFAIRFHLGPGIGAHALADGIGAHLALPDGSGWQFRAVAGEVAIEDSVWVDGAGRPVPVRQLVVQDTVGREGGSFAWALRKIG